MKKLICKIFGHFNKTEWDLVGKGNGVETHNYTHTCKICGNIEKGGMTMFEGPTLFNIK